MGQCVSRLGFWCEWGCKVLVGFEQSLVLWHCKWPPASMVWNPRSISAFPHLSYSQTAVFWDWQLTACLSSGQTPCVTSESAEHLYHRYIWVIVVTVVVTMVARIAVDQSFQIVCAVLTAKAGEGCERCAPPFTGNYKSEQLLSSHMLRVYFFFTNIYRMILYFWRLFGKMEI